MIRVTGRRFESGQCSKELEQKVQDRAAQLVITPAMIEAGERVIISAQELEMVVPDLLAIRVFEAMLEEAGVELDQKSGWRQKTS